MIIDRSTLTGPLGWSLAAIALGLAVLLYQVGLIATAAFAPGVSDQPSELIARLETAHETALEKDRARIDGRNLFYPTRPTPKAPAPPPPGPRDTGPPPPPPPPPPPSGPPPAYQGPSILFVVGDTVWFNPLRVGDRPLKIRVGEEQQGVTVISTAPPWTARLGYEGGEYDVEIFERKYPGLESTAPTASRLEGLVEVSSTGSDDAPAHESASDEEAGTDTDDGAEAPPPVDPPSASGEEDDDERLAAEGEEPDTKDPPQRSRPGAPGGGPDD